MESMHELQGRISRYPESASNAIEKVSKIIDKSKDPQGSLNRLEWRGDNNEKRMQEGTKKQIDR